MTEETEETRSAEGRIFGPEGIDAGTLTTRTLHREEPRQLTGVTKDPVGALLRISTEPCAPGVEGKDVTFFLSAWGDHGGRVHELESAWSRLLERLFPEGETV